MVISVIYAGQRLRGIMALPIKATPDLRGKEAKSFYKRMEKRKAVPEEDYDRAKRLYDKTREKAF